MTVRTLSFALLICAFSALVTASFFAFGPGAAQILLIATAFVMLFFAQRWVRNRHSQRTGKPRSSITFWDLEWQDHIWLVIFGIVFVAIGFIAALLGGA
jgi:hypothetical protein